jgi:hypothetical protein
VFVKRPPDLIATLVTEQYFELQAIDNLGRDPKRLRVLSTDYANRIANLEKAYASIVQFVQEIPVEAPDRNKDVMASIAHYKTQLNEHGWVVQSVKINGTPSPPLPTTDENTNHNARPE